MIIIVIIVVVWWSWMFAGWVTGGGNKTLSQLIKERDRLQDKIDEIIKPTKNLGK